MELGTALEKLGVGLSSLLRYSFGGFLLVVLAILVNPTGTANILKTIPWEITALAAVVVGTGIYAVHRSAVIPIHHLGLCLILFLGDICRRSRISPADSTSPTRWLRSIDVPWSRLMLAYTSLRRSDLFSKQEKKALDISHAESGLVVMLAEGFAAAAIYASFNSSRSNISSLPLWILSAVFWVASYPGAVGQHRLECMRLRARSNEVKEKLRELGILSQQRLHNAESGIPLLHGVRQELENSDDTAAELAAPNEH